VSLMLARRAHESDLPLHLVGLVVCCALYADDDGVGVPSMRDLMWLLGKSYRSILRGTATLRERGILISAGRNGQAIAFRFNAAALRPKSPFVPRGTYVSGGACER
jgi:hypothetical protein